MNLTEWENMCAKQQSTQAHLQQSMYFLKVNIAKQEISSDCEKRILFYLKHASKWRGFTM